MRTANDIYDFLSAHLISPAHAMSIGNFLGRRGFNAPFIVVADDCPLKTLRYDDFVTWFYECEPIYKVGDIVRIRRENIDNPCRVEGIKIELNSKPYGCYLLLKSERKGTEQWVNQRNVELISE